jgi:hypothetical protein
LATIQILGFSALKNLILVKYTSDLNVIGKNSLLFSGLGMHNVMGHLK